MFQIFEKLGGEAAAIDIIAKATGVEPAREVVRKWKASRRIPPLSAVHLLDACTERGIEALYHKDCVSSK